jgi:hypothetical protein
MNDQLPLSLPNPPITAGVYFDTTNLPVTALRDAINAANQQNSQVLAIFRRHGRPLTPSQVWRYGQDRGHQWLLTSVRRSITVLTNGESPALVKLDTKAMGAYGRQEYQWQVVP